MSKAGMYAAMFAADLLYNISDEPNPIKQIEPKSKVSKEKQLQICETRIANKKHNELVEAKKQARLERRRLKKNEN